MKVSFQHFAGVGSRFLLRLVLIGISTHAALFFLFDVLPSADLKAAGWMAADPIALGHYREAMGLNGSFIDRYLSSVGALIHCNLGVTLSGIPVGGILGERLLKSLGSIFIALVFLISAVCVVALWRCSRSPTRSWQLIPLIVWFGLSPTLVIAVAAKGIAISFGWSRVFDESTSGSVLAIGFLSAMVPAAMLISVAAKEAARLMPLSFVTTLISQGRSGISIRIRLLTNIEHALRPLFGRAILQLAGGLVFAEMIWDVPGFGRLFAEGFQTADYALLQGWMLVVATLAFGCSTWESTE